MSGGGSAQASQADWQQAAMRQDDAQQGHPVAMSQAIDSSGSGSTAMDNTVVSVILGSADTSEPADRAYSTQASQHTSIIDSGADGADW